jgi:polyisoprenoid-binding protein YceI
VTEATSAKVSPTDAAVRYLVDAGKSRFTVRAFATGLLSSIGHNPTMAIREYTGEAAFVPGTLEQASLRFSVRSASLEVTDDVSDKDRNDIQSRMTQDVLETDAYPEIVFESSQIAANKMGDTQFSVNAAGNLSLHGVTRGETIYAQVSLAGDTLRAYGEFSLRQTDYGIKLVSVAGGTLKVKDEVKIAFDFTARKQ